MEIKHLFSLCLFITNIIATPIQSRSSSTKLGVVVNINSISTGETLVTKDQARFQALLTHGQAKAKGMSLAEVPVSAINTGQVYTASVGVGASTYKLLIDTGSSITWVGANQAYKPGPNSQDTGQNVSVAYGSGNFSGKEFIDDVTLGSAIISSQTIGVASTTAGIPTGIDGILGIGPDVLTRGIIGGNRTIPTVTDNLVSQGFIDTALVGVSFVPTNSLDDMNGELNFGAPDLSKFTGELSFVRTTGTYPAAYYWGIDQSITYGSSGIPILSTTAGVVDTGTTLVLLATDAFHAYQDATGATFDQKTGFLTVADPSTLQSLFFHVGGATFEFTANAQIWPRALNSIIGGAPGATYLVVSDLGSPSGNGADFINGFTFLYVAIAAFIGQEILNKFN